LSVVQHEQFYWLFNLALERFYWLQWEGLGMPITVEYFSMLSYTG